MPCKGQHDKAALISLDFYDSSVLIIAFAVIAEVLLLTATFQFKLREQGGASIILYSSCSYNFDSLKFSSITSLSKGCSETSEESRYNYSRNNSN